MKKIKNNTQDILNKANEIYIIFERIEFLKNAVASNCLNEKGKQLINEKLKEEEEILEHNLKVGDEEWLLMTDFNFRNEKIHIQKKKLLPNECLDFWQEKLKYFKQSPNYTSSVEYFPYRDENNIEYITAVKEEIKDLKIKLTETIHDQPIPEKKQSNITNTQPETKDEQPQLQELFVFQNNLDNVLPIDVYNYFNKELVLKKHITKEVLETFLKLAFENKIFPKVRFSFTNMSTKQKIMKVFYIYYKVIAGKPYGKQKEYAALLGEYFKGFETNTVSTNFNK